MLLLVNKFLSKGFTCNNISIVLLFDCLANYYIMKLIILPLVILFIGLTSCRQPEVPVDVPKNIILFIGDGMGYSHVDAASMFLHGDTGRFVFHGVEWLRLAQATYSAQVLDNTLKIPSDGYSPRLAWSDTAFLKRAFTDSGAASTALSTGRKTFYGAIGVGVKYDTLLLLTQFAKQLGKAAGVVSSVQLSHATPAGFAAHNESRDNYAEIAQSMILKSYLDVIIGCGHPEFNDDGLPANSDPKYVGGPELWQQLQTSNTTEFSIEGKDYVLGDINGDDRPDPWSLVTDSAAFAELALGKTTIPQRLLGVPQVHTTLQQSRSGDTIQIPWQQPMVRNLPSLEQMTKAAINVLNQNQNGFFLMVEGGAIDWAGHDNHLGRLIEEMACFVKAIEASVRWVEEHSNWQETLIIVTSDHETGLLWGPATKETIFVPLENRGKGQLPGVQWHSTDHTNSLVPLYARGAGANALSLMAGEYDPVRGRFLQNTSIPQAVMLMWK